MEIGLFQISETTEFFEDVEFGDPLTMEDYTKQELDDCVADWDEYHKDVDVFINLQYWKQSTAAGLASKIKGITQWMTEFWRKFDKARKSRFKMKELLEDYFSRATEDYDDDTFPMTWSFQIETVASKDVYARDKTEWKCRVNPHWINYVLKKVYDTIQEMRIHLEEVKRLSKLRKREKVECSCGRSYTADHKERHMQSHLHRRGEEERLQEEQEQAEEAERKRKWLEEHVAFNRQNSEPVPTLKTEVRKKQKPINA